MSKTNTLQDRENTYTGRVTMRPIHRLSLEEQVHKTIQESAMRTHCTCERARRRRDTAARDLMGAVIVIGFIVAAIILWAVIYGCADTARWLSVHRPAIVRGIQGR